MHAHARINNFEHAVRAMRSYNATYRARVYKSLESDVCTRLVGVEQLCVNVDRHEWRGPKQLQRQQWLLREDTVRATLQ